MSEEFKVGDRVKIVKAGLPYDGQTGTILKIRNGIRGKGALAEIKADRYDFERRWNLYVFKLQKLYTWKKL